MLMVPQLLAVAAGTYAVAICIFIAGVSLSVLTKCSYRKEMISPAMSTNYASSEVPLQDRRRPVLNNQAPAPRAKEASSVQLPPPQMSSPRTSPRQMLQMPPQPTVLAGPVVGDRVKV